MKKIALVVEHWGKGGTETYVKGLVKFVIDKGYKVKLIILDESKNVILDFLDLSDVYKIKRKNLYGLLHNLNVDIVNLHLYKNLLYATAICTLLRLKIINTLHMPINSWGVKMRINWRVGLHLSDVTIGVSRLVNKQINNKSLWQMPLPGYVDDVFFYNGIPLLGKLKNLTFSTYRIAAIGRLSEEKSWDTLLNAVFLLQNKNEVVIDFYGDGDIKQDIIKLANKLCVNIVIHGHLNQKDLAISLRNNHLSVLPSRFEGLGLSAIESMAAGIPIITSDFEAAADFINDGITGNIFKINNHVELANIIDFHIKNPDKSSMIAEAGRDSISEKFSKDKVYKDYLVVFDTI